MSEDDITKAAGAVAGGIVAGARGIAGVVADTSRPFGVTLLAGWVAFYGGLYFVLLLLSLCTLNFISSIFPPPAPVQPGSVPSFSPMGSAFQLDAGSVLLFLLFLALLAVAHIALARGLYHLKSWAYWSVAGLEGFTVLYALINLMVSHNGVLFITNVFLPIITLVYMFAVPGVRKAFDLSF